MTSTLPVDHPTTARPPAAGRGYAVRDTVTLLRRTLKHLLRYPSLTITVIAMPVVFLLLFVYVFGGTLGAGLPGAEITGTPTGADAGGADQRAAYLHFLTPTLLVLTVAAVANSTAILVARDAGEGIFDRFRTLAISRSAPLAAHVLAALVQTFLALVVVAAMALAVGYRSDASPAGWLGAAGVLLALGIAITWLCVALGLASGSVEAASNAPLPLILLPFLSSGFVPTESMPSGLAWVAEHQPFTPVIDTVRALLDGTDPGSDLWWALGWCLLITAVSWVWARRVFARPRAS